jgi:hypothetical protein
MRRVVLLCTVALTACRADSSVTMPEPRQPLDRLQVEAGGASTADDSAGDDPGGSGDVDNGNGDGHGHGGDSDPGSSGGDPGSTGGDPGSTGGDPDSTGGDPGSTGGDPLPVANLSDWWWCGCTDAQIADGRCMNNPAADGFPEIGCHALSTDVTQCVDDVGWSNGCLYWYIYDHVRTEKLGYGVTCPDGNGYECKSSYYPGKGYIDCCNSWHHEPSCSYMYNTSWDCWVMDNCLGSHEPECPSGAYEYSGTYDWD